MQYLLSVCCFFKSDLHVFVVHNEAQVSPILRIAQTHLLSSVAFISA